MIYLPAEWHRQSAVQLTWPHAGTDWDSVLDEVEECYYHLAREISQRELLLIVAPDINEVQNSLESGLYGRIPEQERISPDALLHRICYFSCETNDTWARDHAFLTCLDDADPARRILMDFRFNGWGMKFAANFDNQINSQLYQSGLLDGVYLDCRDFVLEGGAVESDGKGTILTTSSCMLAPNRNEPLDKKGIEQSLHNMLNAKRVLWLNHGGLAGDDTDGHIDTLARFCNPHTIAYVECEDKADEHYEELSLMKKELQDFRTLDGKPYQLVALPLPDAIYDEEGDRLPATYANFLIMNDAVLCPTYNQPMNDAQAIKTLSEVFTDREVVGVDCSVLIRQHGSLHCCTMQYPGE